MNFIIQNIRQLVMLEITTLFKPKGRMSISEMTKDKNDAAELIKKPGAEIYILYKEAVKGMTISGNHVPATKNAKSIEY